jgi:Zn-dependent protease with chaperone function
VSYVLHLLLALGTLFVPELLDVEGAAGGALALPLLALLPYALARLTGRLVLRGRFRAATFAERVLAFTPVLGQLLAVVLVGWLDLIAAWSGGGAADAWPGLGMLLEILPYLVLELFTIDARARLSAGGERSAATRARVFQLRLFLSALLPFGLYLVASGLVGRHEGLRVRLEEVAVFGAVFTLALLLVFALVVPRMLARTWDTAPMEPGGTRDLLEGLARNAGFRCRDLLVWRTGDQMANAAIVGFTPRSRVVLFSDVLLATLDPFEVAAVFAHEMGHARRGHVAVFGGYTLAVLLGGTLLADHLSPDDGTLTTAILGGAFLFWIVTFGLFSRRFELDADLESLRLLGGGAHLARALRLVTGAHAYRRSSWRHPSTEERIRFLAEVERDPRVGERLRSRLRSFSRLALGFLAVVLLFQGLALADSWTEDQLVVDLRLGRYEAAASRLEDARAAEGAVDERLEELVVVAAALPVELRAAEELEDLALAAFAAGDDGRAVDLLELAYLRGHPDVAALGDVADALDVFLEGTGETPDPETLPPDWGDVLRARLDG